MAETNPYTCCAAMPRPGIDGAGMDQAALSYYLVEQTRFDRQRHLLSLMCAILLASQLDDGEDPFAELVQKRIPDLQAELLALRPAQAPQSCAALRHHLDQATQALGLALREMQSWLGRRDAGPLPTMLAATARLMEHCAALLPGADMLDRTDSCCAPTGIATTRQ